MQVLNKHYKKKIILIDRFVDSTMAYQHFGLGVEKKLINFLNFHLLKKFKIDFTFLNIVNQNNMIKRLKSRKSLNRYDRFNYDFYKRVQNGYLKLCKKNKRKYLIIDSNLDININKSLIIDKINKLI